jgi:hypothetical protein
VDASVLLGVVVAPVGVGVVVAEDRSEFEDGFGAVESSSGRR